jgi:hypothetical protein
MRQPNPDDTRAPFTGSASVVRAFALFSANGEESERCGFTASLSAATGRSEQIMAPPIRTPANRVAKHFFHIDNLAEAGEFRRQWLPD